VEQTEVSMAYDRENLYFAFRCYDKPDKIKTSITSRDNILRDDWVCINLDSFNDQQGLYALYINPLGIQADSRFAVGQEDFSIDLVWFSAGTLDSSGYIVEVQIPLKSIRYADGEPVAMSVFFERFISRRSEHSSYPELDPAKGMAFLTQMTPMLYYGVKHYMLLEVLPAFTFSQHYAHRQGELVNDGKRTDLSLTMKYGITSDLILDGTYNPDFSQVEADAGQVDINLRFSLFYPEKRPFFLEGRDNFTLGATAFSELDPVQSIVHTRTIVDPLVGAKLTGKIGDKNTVASIYAMDELLENERHSGETYAHFPIVRYKRALSEESYIGGIYAGHEMKSRFNRVVGIDNQIRVSEASMLESSGFISWVKNDGSSSIERGHALGLRYYYETRDISYSGSLRDISETFTADMGYITRTGITTLSALIRPKFYPASGIIQRIDAEMFSAQTRDKFSSLWETFNQVSLTTLFGGSSQFKVRYSYSTEVFGGQKFQTGGFQTSLGGQLTNQLYANLLYRRAKAIYYDSLYQGMSNRITATVRYQPSDNLQAEGSFIFSNFYRDEDGRKIYDYPIGRFKLIYQLNRYLFFRGIVEYNDFRREMKTDFLASFTYIPGTVIHLGYGSLYEKIRWENNGYTDSNRFLETQRGFFFKASYLWRM
jgi:hypothetical protein